MKFTSALFLTTAILAGSAFAKKHRSSSTDSSSSSSSTDSSSSGSSSSGSSSSGSSSSGSSSSGSSSSSSSSSSNSSDSTVVEDFGINGCENADAFTVLYSGFRHYDQIVKDNKKFVTFLASKAEIKSKSNASVVKNIKKNKKKQTLALRFSKPELSDLEKMKRTKKINKAVKALVKKFKKDTGLKLKYVMLPAGAAEKVVKAFNKNKVAVISKTKKVSNGKNLDVAGFNGVVVVDTKTVKKDDLKKLKKAMKKSSVAGIKLSECIPKGSTARKAAESDAETTDVATDAETVVKTAAMKAAETEAETEAEENSAAKETEQKPETEGETSAKNSAASVAVSSVMSVAAIAAVAALLL